ncbi:hypothetical protein Val02_04250 [Virgisporangium aliadipatigenens]|uniref:DUF7134 domain-containing protein n=1 Tax=Virgisporangium aliadipatigenens TaxID=741659 RepID=A0A8J4DMM3_9ACTN|nr:hypothetical protein [Virgisporangium aliadipatigenens]GIJ43539.1 hypothetical protein Val02_04250 [Virgisporangium aliadipatigenens]
MGESLAFRMSRWSAAHPARVDAAVTGVLAAGCVPAGVALAGATGLLLSLGLVVPLAGRRRSPLGAAAVVGAVAVAQLVTLPFWLPADLAVALVVHTVAARVPSRAARFAALVVGVAGSVAAGFRWSTPPEYRANALAAAAVLSLLTVLI